MSLRRLLRNLGLKVGSISRGKFGQRIRELAAGNPMLEAATHAPGVTSEEGKREMGDKGRLYQPVRSSADEISRPKDFDQDVPVTEVWTLEMDEACTHGIGAVIAGHLSGRKMLACKGHFPDDAQPVGARVDPAQPYVHDGPHAKQLPGLTLRTPPGWGFLTAHQTLVRVVATVRKRRKGASRASFAV